MMANRLISNGQEYFGGSFEHVRASKQVYKKDITNSIFCASRLILLVCPIKFTWMRISAQSAANASFSNAIAIPNSTPHNDRHVFYAAIHYRGACMPVFDNGSHLVFVNYSLFFLQYNSCFSQSFYIFFYGL